MHNAFYQEILNRSKNGYAYHEIILDQNSNPIDYRYLEVNPAFESFMGLRAEDVVGKTIREIMPEIVKDEFDWISVYGDIALHGNSREFETFSQSLGRWYKVIAFSPEKNHFVTLFSDISSEKQQTENLSELTSIFSHVVKNAPIPIMIHRDDGKVLNISDAWTEITGYSRSDIPTIDLWTKAAYGMNQANVVDFINKLYDLKTRQHDGEYSIRTKDDGRVLWDFYSAYIGNSPDRHKMAMSVAIDITEARSNFDALVHSRQLFETTLLSVGDGVICTDRDGKVTLINHVAEQLTGWSRAEAAGKNVEEVFSIRSERDGTVCENIVGKVLQTGVLHELANSTILVSKDGRQRPIADSAAPIVTGEGEVVGAVLVFRDYSETHDTQRRMESLLAELKRTQLLLNASLNSPIDIIILSIDKEYKYLYFNETHRKTMKNAYNSNPEIGKCLFDFMTSQDDILRARINYGKALSGIVHTTVEQYGDLEIVYYETVYSPVRDENGTVIGASAYARDVSERFKAEKRIRESEEKLKIILNSTTEGIYGIDLDGNCTFVNASFLKLLGYENEPMFLGKNIHDMIHRKHGDGSASSIEDSVLRGNTGIVCETEFCKRDGTLLHVEVSADPQYRDDRLVGAVITFRDVSDRILARKKLEEEKRLAQEYLDIAGVMIVVLDRFGQVQLINKKGCEILGKNQSEILGKNWFEYFLPPEEVEAVKKVFADIFLKKTDLISHYENAIVNAQNEQRVISWYNSILYDLEGNVLGVLSSGADITDIRIANAKLKESEKRFKTLFEKAPFGYQSLDSTGHFLEVNQKWLDILGYERDEIIGKWFGDFLLPEYKVAFENRFKLFKKLGVIHSEFQMRTKTGTPILVGFDGNIAYSPNHEFVQTHCTVSDITEIHLANEKLRKSELRYRELINNLDAGVIVYAQDMTILSLNQRAQELLGISEDDLIGKRDGSSDVVLVDANSKRLDLADYPVSVILRDRTPIKDFIVGMKRESGTAIKWISVNGVPLLNEDGSLDEVVVSFTDISNEKRRQDEIAYLGNHDYLTNLYNRRHFAETFTALDHPRSYPLGVMMLDVNGLKIINDAFGHETGDVALKKVARILEESFREEDVICRIGGDEFAVILPHITQEMLESIKETIKIKCAQSSVQNITLSLATGYEIKTADYEESLDEILKLAENHMYRHKLAESISVRNNAIKAILITLTSKYQLEKIHSARVSQMCRKIGEALGLKEEELKELALAGMYHDIGKISIPDAILNKPGKLTQEEYNIIKTHPEVSYQILRAADEYSDLAIHALHHHERWDGYGYPSGLKGEEIPLFSRIICVADAYEAMTSVRPYKNKLSETEALNEVIRCSGTQFDPRIARLFVDLARKKQVDEPE